MSLKYFAGSIKARLDSDLFEQRFKPVRGKITASDIDLKLDQNGWSCVVEGKPVLPSLLAAITNFEQLRIFHERQFKGGQRFSLEDFQEKGFLTCVAYLTYVLKEGYEEYDEPCGDGAVVKGIRGPKGGNDFTHPYRHIPLAYYITVPHAELKMPAIGFLQLDYFRDFPEVKILSSALEDKEFAILFPQPTKECGLWDLDNEKHGGCFFEISSHFARQCKYQKFLDNGLRFPAQVATASPPIDPFDF